MMHTRHLTKSPAIYLSRSHIGDQHAQLNMQNFRFETKSPSFHSYMHSYTMTKWFCPTRIQKISKVIQSLLSVKYTQNIYRTKPYPPCLFLPFNLCPFSTLLLYSQMFWSYICHYNLGKYLAICQPRKHLGNFLFSRGKNLTYTHSS